MPPSTTLTPRRAGRLSSSAGVWHSSPGLRAADWLQAAPRMSRSTAPPRPRTTSPFLILRWHVAMVSSIGHRVTGMALYVGALILAGWAVALATGQEAFETYTGLLGSIPGKIVLFGLTVSVFFHLANGV